jgi:trans-2,3-dihydro-3-hydroxyanthranilate isomerase
MEFYILDVFAEEKYSGNQLAVVREAKALAAKEMQRIAREMNYSETAFILSGRGEKGGYAVRIFTPEKEVPFAGHPVLGTAYVIQREVIRRPVTRVVLNLKIGQIPVSLNYRGKEVDTLVMRQKEPIFGRTLDTTDVAGVLSIDESMVDGRYPVQEVSTGLPFIIVPLRTLEALKQVKIDRERYYELIQSTDAKAILAFAPETYKRENHLSVRVFADYYGVPEDPATGSGNGCLAGYLVRHRYFRESSIDIRVEQGYEIGRPSLLYLKAEKTGRKIEIHVGGRVVMVAKGYLL